ncbi:RNAPII degradation factor [Massospora cicadina]|nr:RNAPII degradation factor [Massospora cicadina]
MSHRTRAHRSNKPKSKEESDEIALLRATHSVNLRYLNELFPDWSDEDLLYTLQDTYGDLELTVARISEVKSRKSKKETLGAAQSTAAKGSLPRGQDDKKARGNFLRGVRLAPNQKPSGQPNLQTKDLVGTHSLKRTMVGGIAKLPMLRKLAILAWEPQMPRSQSVKLSLQVAKSAPAAQAPISRDRKPRINHSNSQESRYPARQNADAPRSSSDNFSNLGGKSSAEDVSIQNGTPKPAPTNTWAKIASRAAVPKPAALKPAPVEAEAGYSNWDAPDSVELIQTQACDESNPSLPEPLEEPAQNEQDGKIAIGGDKITGEVPEEVKASDEAEANQVKKASSDVHHLSHSSGVVIPGTMAAKMSEISKKFAKMETSDLDSSVPEQASDVSQSKLKHSPQQVGSKLPPPGIPIVPPGIRTSRPLTASKPSFVPASFTNGTTELNTKSEVKEPAPELASEGLTVEATTQPHISSASEQRNGARETGQHVTHTVPQHVTSAQPTKASQHSSSTQPTSHEVQHMHHSHQSYYTQGLAHTHGAPVQPPMHPQLMHQHQGQNSYGGFGYGGVPAYQAPGGPADGPIYYPHPYYTQPSHQHMFPGYPGAPGLQHLPHLQHQQQHGYSNPHTLQQQHQGHQQNPQQQYPPTQQSPHHYPHHQQQTNPNMRYQSWNN